MPSVSTSVPHQLSKAEAMERIKKFGVTLQEKYEGQFKDFDESWSDNLLNFAFKTMGMAFKGTVQVEEDEVKVDGNLPFAAMMFKGRIESEVRGALEKLLA
ncbi:MAG: hypothetical protein DWQ31_15485 [Planctomycetota bacterium]|nr:MAG: hypothetical protein DWQ31_15485 [Planctomycetota bacterium]REK25667.1 MAG: hypothetical protein DWQ42_10440 [Planctomycetota bacterium]REK46587.1 MAG: hypothetical protein DWQ46_06865 [Planctomycetota bacterium]